APTISISARGLALARVGGACERPETAYRPADDQCKRCRAHRRHGKAITPGHSDLLWIVIAPAESRGAAEHPADDVSLSLSVRAFFQIAPTIHWPKSIRAVPAKSESGGFRTRCEV